MDAVAQIFEVLANRRRNIPDTPSPSDNSSFESPVGFLKRSNQHCWPVKGIPRERFEQDLKPEIFGTLDYHFGSTLGNDNLTISLYMIGRSAETALPTVVFILRNSQLRKAVRRRMKESGILSRHLGFESAYEEKDPGSSNIVPLANGGETEACIRPINGATEVFYDLSRPFASVGLPIYIRHPSSLRPATANAVRVGDRFFFQTVHHAFCDSSAKANIAAPIVEEYLETDLDSESESDDDDEAHVATTSLASRSSESLFGSVLASPDPANYLRRLSSISGCSSPTTDNALRVYASNDSWPDDASIISSTTSATNGSNARDTTSGLEIPVPTIVQRSVIHQLELPTMESLSLLGNLLAVATESDWALIEITNSHVEEALLSLSTQDSMRSFAYDIFASPPKEDVEIYTCTASGGKLYGTLSDTPSYTYLPNSRSFQEVYIVRLNGQLADGDCGAAINNATTGETYGHLIAGCKTTGTAYILAAHRVSEELREISMNAANNATWTKAPSHVLSHSLSARENKGTNPLQKKYELNNSPLYSKHSLEEARSSEHKPHASTAPSPLSIHPPSLIFLNLFPKQWPSEFSGSHKPREDSPYIEETLKSLRSMGEEFDGDDLQMFMEPYDDDLAIFDVREAIRFMQEEAGTASLGTQRRSRKRKGTAWLDDRTRSPHLAQHSRVCRKPCIPRTLPENSAGISNTECDITDAFGEVPSSREQTERGIDGLQSADPNTVQAVRSYNVPLTSGDLQSHLREKRFDNPRYLDADRRLIYIADPDADDLAALVRTATAHQQQSLQYIICKYLSLNTCIKVTIPEGYSSFHLEFHIPYFALRRSRLDHTFTQRKMRTHRGWMNVAFLNSKHNNIEEEGTWGIHQAQISVTLCGTDNSYWTAYCFEDRHFDEDTELGEDEHTAFYQSDQIANGNFGAEDTIWNPREYFLRVLLIRMRQVHKEWVELLRAIESGIKEHSWGRFFYSSNRDGTPSNMDYSAALNWFESIAQLLDKILDDIGKTNDAWIHFASPTGDSAYFSDTHADPNMVKTFIKLTDVFSELLVLEKRLRRIADQCEKRAQTVNLRLTSGSMQSAQLTAYFIFPFTIVSTFFSIPVRIMGFERNIVSFVVAMILFAVFLQLLLFFREGRIWRLPWWEKLSEKMKPVWSGDDSSTAENRLGVISLQRRTMQAAYI